MFSRWTTAFSVAIAIGAAQAEPLDWVKTREEMSAISQIAAGYAWGQICDKRVDTASAARFMEARLGPGRQYSATQVADMMFAVVGTIALQRQLAGQGGCAAVRKAYGPGGSAIPGLLY